MTELEYQKELLRTKIEAHRTILGLEIQAARAAFDPLGAALSMVGVDDATAEILAPALRAATTALTRRTEHEEASGEET